MAALEMQQSAKSRKITSFMKKIPSKSCQVLGKTAEAENDTTQSKVHNKDIGKIQGIGEKISGRKSLQTLQASSDRKGLTRPGDPHKTAKKGKRKSPESEAEGCNRQKRAKIHKITADKSNSIQVFEDPKSPESKPQNTADKPTDCSCSCHGSEEKTTEQEAYELMVQDPPPENYWKEVAEERRKALADTLEENQRLHDKVEELTQENQKLSKLASEAEYFAAMLKMVTEEKEDDNENSESEKSKEEDREDENSESDKSIPWADNSISTVTEEPEDTE